MSPVSGAASAVVPGPTGSTAGSPVNVIITRRPSYELVSIFFARRCGYPRFLRGGLGPAGGAGAVSSREIASSLGFCHMCEKNLNLRSCRRSSFPQGLGGGGSHRTPEAIAESVWFPNAHGNSTTISISSKCVELG